MQHVPRLVGQEGQVQGDAREVGLQVLARGAQVHAHTLPSLRPAQQLQQPRDHREDDRRQRYQGPRQGGAGEKGPAGDEQRHQGRRDQAAPQVVENLPARDQRQAVALEAGARRHPGEQPPQDLPVTTHPPMLALRVHQHVGRVVVHQLDVGDEGGPRVNPLEQIV